MASLTLIRTAKFLSLVLTVLVAFSGMGCDHKQRGLTVRMGDFSNLERGPDLTKLLMITQYYLAENLGLPALVDWVPGKISSGFAASWHYDGKAKLSITPRKDLKWSDGSPIELTEIAAHFQLLRDKPRLHMPSFAHLKHVEVKGDSLELTFAQDVHDILEELCRADGVLHSGDWHKTTGAYFIERLAADEMVLKRNPFFPKDLLAGVTPPETVTIKRVPVAAMTDFFAQKKIDLSMNAGFASFAPHPAWEQAGAKAYWGTAAVVFYLRFSERLSQEVRGVISRAFHAAREEFIEEAHLKKFYQMIPTGFASSLSSNEIPIVKLDQYTQCKTSKPLEIEFWDGYDSLPLKSGRKFSDVIKEELTKRGCKFTLSVLESATHFKETAKPKYDAVIDGFLGNARNADGSWSFLDSATPSIIKDADVKKMLNDARKVEDHAAREAAFKKAHIATIESLDVFPLFITSQAMFHHPDLDLSRIHPLDLRMRFWMMEWKH